MDNFSVSRAEGEIERINNEHDVDSQSKHIELMERQLQELKMENEILRNQLTQKYQHSSCNTPRNDQETMEKQKTDLDRAKAANKFLLEGLQTRKQQLSDSQTENFELNVKLKAAKKKNVELLKDVRFLNFQIDNLLQDRLQLHMVQEENEKLRSYLMAHHVDVRTGRRIAGYLIGKNKEQVNGTTRSFTKQKKNRSMKTVSLQNVDQVYEENTDSVNKYPLSYSSMFKESLKQKDK